MSAIRKIIRTDGSEEVLDGTKTMWELRKLLGVATFDSVNLRHMGWPAHVMLVDDHGHETTTVDHGDGRIELRSIGHRKPVNEKATALYHLNCVPGTVHKIVGDVAIVPDEDFA